MRFVSRTKRFCKRTKPLHQPYKAFRQSYKAFVQPYKASTLTVQSISAAVQSIFASVQNRYTTRTKPSLQSPKTRQKTVQYFLKKDLPFCHIEKHIKPLLIYFFMLQKP